MLPSVAVPSDEKEEEKTASFPSPMWEQAFVVITFAVMVTSNVLSNTVAYNGQTPGALSDANPTYITPDGLTFSVWGFIYLFEATAVLYQALPRFREHPALIPARRWMVAAFCTNAAWLPVFGYKLWWLSLAIILSYLYSLQRTYEHLKVCYASTPFTAECEEGGHKKKEATEAASWHLKLLVFVGFSLNQAWVVVASLLNFTTVARNSDIITTTVAANSTSTSGYTSDDQAVIGGNPDWAIFCICVAAGIACIRLVRHVDVPYALVTAWALFGINRMQTSTDDSKFPTAGLSAQVADWSLGVAIAVLAVAVPLALLIVGVQLAVKHLGSKKK